MNEIKPCPFCGSTNIDFKTKNGAPNCLVCEDCGCTGPEAHAKIDNWEFSTIPSELIELWNKRK
jgi:transcription initiation factor TFIIIB Brf1 subunit/transcription initiation factor TFIIB